MTQSAPITLRPALKSDFPAPRLLPLETDIFTGPEFSNSYNLITNAFGEEISQGSLLAYLLRRFGYPNAPSDPDKELAAYLLTTSHPDMLMRISPYAGATSHISFTFMVPGEISKMVHMWPARHLDAHKNAFPEWLVQQGLIPDWFDNLRKEAAKNGYAPIEAERASIPQTLFMLDILTHKAQSIPAREKQSDAKLSVAADWLEGVRNRYNKEHPKPEIEYRDADWQNWAEEDPVKPFAKAIVDTCHEFFRPVWVRDIPIDPMGQMADDDAMEKIDDLQARFGRNDEDHVSLAAGYSVGALLNEDPEGYADLMHQVAQLGGDTKANIAKAVALLSAASTNDQ